MAKFSNIWLQNFVRSSHFYFDKCGKCAEYYQLLFLLKIATWAKYFIKLWESLVYVTVEDIFTEDGDLYLHPGHHGVQLESGESGVEVHLEGQSLWSQEREGGGVAARGPHVQSIVTSGSFPGTLEGQFIIPSSLAVSVRSGSPSESERGCPCPLREDGCWAWLQSGSHLRPTQLLCTTKNPLCVFDLNRAKRKNL